MSFLGLIWSFVGLLSLLYASGFRCSCSSYPVDSESCGSITGVVIVVGTDQPISGVVVTCASLTSTTSTDGRYEIRGIPVGNHTIQASKSDYEPYGQTVDVLAEKSTNVDIPMTLSTATTILHGGVSHSVEGPAARDK